MLSRIYSKAKDKFAKGEIAWKKGGDTFGAFLIDAILYTPDFLKDEFLKDVPLEARAGNMGQGTLGNAGILDVLDPSDGGACDAEDLGLDGMPMDKVFEHILVFKKGRNDAGSPLIVLISEGENLPVEIRSPKIMIEWDNGPNRIFRI